LSQEDQIILKELEAAVEFGISVNRKALSAGQTLYIDFPREIPATVAQAFLEKYRQAGWKHLRLYPDKTEPDQTVIELAKVRWYSFFMRLFNP
jgi:hypothetical protein